MLVIQLSDTRTGSTFFYRCLDSHPDIDANPEIFRISPRRFDINYLNRKFEKKTTCKIMYNHVKFFNIFSKLKELNIIHVMRRVPYKKVLSDVVSNIKSEGLEKKYYDPERFLKHVTEYEGYIELYKNLKRYTDNYIEFFMEDFIQPDLTMTQNEAARLCDFLKVPKMKLRSDSKKLTPDKNHWDYFENADEIKKLLKEV